MQTSKILVRRVFVPVPRTYFENKGTYYLRIIEHLVICVKKEYHNRCFHVKRDLYLVTFNKFMEFSFRLLSSTMG